jgi:hypothetical protein
MGILKPKSALPHLCSALAPKRFGEEPSRSISNAAGFMDATSKTGLRLRES